MEMRIQGVKSLRRLLHNLQGDQPDTVKDKKGSGQSLEVLQLQTNQSGD